MRKAAPKHRTRRKASPSNSSTSGGLTTPLSGCFDEDFEPGDEVGFGYNMNEQIIENAGDTRKEPINDADEKALITKNYRLAKELSDLKSKHREEAKAVTRLTMENVSMIYVFSFSLYHYSFPISYCFFHPRVKNVSDSGHV